MNKSIYLFTIYLLSAKTFSFLEKLLIDAFEYVYYIWHDVLKYVYFVEWLNEAD